MYTKNFKQISKKDVKIAGGKGASLGEMTQAKIPVPGGFIILSDAFDKFIKEVDIEKDIKQILLKIKFGSHSSVERGSEKIINLISNHQIPKDIYFEVLKEYKKLNAKFIAVRSSATSEDSKSASWAGELETYLNITEKDLGKSIKKCWASLFTPRAIIYRNENKLIRKKISVAVVIQKMVQSDVSGICFTVNPVTENKNEMVIEAGYGLGEAIVGGKITPDTFVVDKKKNKILDANISEQKIMIVKSQDKTKEVKVVKSKQTKQKISNLQILKVAKLCSQVEKHYKKPQDIEWGIEKGKLYILQSRPITTL